MNTQANELQHEESPYLQQHASNPVDWFPWGEKALEKAKKENKLIFLSIGYSTCHWCHVMEHESFENEAIAKLLNQDFVNIKVDREEYPNIDKFYQKIYQMMNQKSGGWPLTVIMTPEAKVFFTATYLPPEAKYGTKGLNEILPDLVELYIEKNELVSLMVKNIEKKTVQNSLIKVEDSSIKIDSNLSNIFMMQVHESYDQVNKGVGTHPKFPRATTFDTLLDVSRLNLDLDAKRMAEEALTAMAKGGIYDQIEGGFYRYATDEAWMIPHFEKMLYTNAELLETYANAYKMSLNPLFKKVMDETIENIYARFEHDNLFYSASDADSDKIEGKYFVFEYEETQKALEKEGFSKVEAKTALTYFNITENGNFHILGDDKFDIEVNNPYLTDKEVPEKLEKIKEVLFKIRSKRNYPFIDNKVQTSWNVLFIHALFKAKENEKALASLDALVKNLYLKDELYHQMVTGRTPKVKAYLEDYAFLISTLIDAYQATLDDDYLALAKKLNKQSIKKFYKEKQWHMSDDSFKSIAELHDASYRSSMAVSIENILKLAYLSDDYDAYEMASKMLNLHAKKLNEISSSMPYATKVALMLERKIIVIKASKENILANEKKIAELNYPYVLVKAVKQNDYSACTMEKCFSTHDNMDAVLQDIESMKH
jgi:uncharacterized protein YyaL (SSP411 family)